MMRLSRTWKHGVGVESGVEERILDHDEQVFYRPAFALLTTAETKNKADLDFFWQQHQQEQENKQQQPKLLEGEKRHERFYLLLVEITAKGKIDFVR